MLPGLLATPGILLLIATLSVVSTPVARAESSGNMIQITPAQVRTGPQLSWGQCPCFRWTVQFQGLGGRIETRDFLISSDALFAFQGETNPYFQRWQMRLQSAGAVETLWRGGHIGIGFQGITWGQDLDRGYSDILRSGLYALVNLILTDSARLDIRSGYAFESMRVNEGPRIERGNFEQTLKFGWRSRSWNGQIAAHIGFPDRSLPFEVGPRFGAVASTRLRVLTLADLRAGLSFNVSYEHDPLLDALGLNRERNWVAVGLSMDFSYVMNRDTDRFRGGTNGSE